MASRQSKVLGRSLTAVILCAVCVSGTMRPTLAQSGEGSREQATLIDEQIRLLRKLDRLRSQMGVLADRFEGGGPSVHAAKLLRRATEELEVRDGEGQAMTLGETMEAVRADIESGRPMTALERQDLAVQRLERLLDILLDRQPLESLEEALAELKAIEMALGQLADDEQRLQEQTAELREESANDSPARPRRGHPALARTATLAVGSE